MELSAQGMVTDGAGKLSSSLHSPVAPSLESLSTSLSLSLRLVSPLPAASLGFFFFFFSVSPSFCSLPVPYLLTSLLLFSVESVCLLAPPVVFVKKGKGG